MSQGFSTANKLQAALAATVVGTGLLAPSGVTRSDPPASTLRPSRVVRGNATPGNVEERLLRRVKTSRSYRRPPTKPHHKAVPKRKVILTHPQVSHVIGTGIWDKIAQCESSGNWQDTAGYYEGGLQFAPSTWKSYGGYQFALHAYNATRGEQIIVAIRVRDGWHGQSAQGWNAWPVCSRRAGAQ